MAVPITAQETAIPAIIIPVSEPLGGGVAGACGASTLKAEELLM